MIIIFTFFYTAILVNPREYAERFKREGAFIPGVKPGVDTADHIDNVLSKITFPLKQQFLFDPIAFIQA